MLHCQFDYAKCPLAMPFILFFRWSILLSSYKHFNIVFLQFSDNLQGYDGCAYNFFFVNKSAHYVNLVSFQKDISQILLFIFQEDFLKKKIKMYLNRCFATLGCGLQPPEFPWQRASWEILRVEVHISSSDRGWKTLI